MHYIVFIFIIFGVFLTIATLKWFKTTPFGKSSTTAIAHTRPRQSPKHFAAMNTTSLACAIVTLALLQTVATPQSSSTKGNAICTWRPLSVHTCHRASGRRWSCQRIIRKHWRWSTSSWSFGASFRGTNASKDWQNCTKWLFGSVNWRLVRITPRSNTQG